jgi:hypothetical protein
MIEALLFKVVFAIPSLWNIYVSKESRPFSFLELSIIVWGCCFIAGWYLTGKRILKLYQMEGITMESKPTLEVECFEDTVKNGLMSVAWMLKVNDKFTFFFKSLYWFSYAYIHSLFIFIVLAALAYTYIIFKLDGSDSPDTVYQTLGGAISYVLKGENIEKSTDDKTNWVFPALISMTGMFAFFDSKFILMHVYIFLISFITFYLCCMIFLEVEEDDNKNIKQITVNRYRFKYLLYISYIFVDSCYMLFEFIMMLYIEVPKSIKDSIEAFKRDRIAGHINELLDNSYTPPEFKEGQKGTNFDIFKNWVLSLNLEDLGKSKLISLVRGLSNREESIMEIFKHTNSAG